MTLVLYLLADLRAAAIVGAIIPLALLGTFIGLACRYPADLLSLGAISWDHRRRRGHRHRTSSDDWAERKDDDHRPQQRTTLKQSSK